MSVESKPPVLPLRPNVCMIVLNRAGRIFLGERFREPGVWQFPQGGVNPDDAAIEHNALRELHEELGADISQFRVLKVLSHRHEYEFSNPPAYARGKWRGQSQVFVAVEFLGEDSDICLNRYEQELQDFRWCTIPEVLKLAEPKRLPGYLPAIEELRSILKPSSI